MEEKKWIYKEKEYTMRQAIGYDYKPLKGKYILNGHYCTERFIWDNIEDEDDFKQLKAKRMAQAFVRLEEYFTNNYNKQ